LHLGPNENGMPMAGNSCAAISGDSPWWALYTRHQHEKTVAEMLSSKGFDVFLPLYDSMRRWKDRNKLLSLPLFPGYVFVRGGLSRKLQVVSTPGVHMILYRGEQVAVIPDAEIQAIRAAVDGHYRVEPHPFLKCGDQVRVIRGSLEGVKGILTRKKNLIRLVLSVEMLAQSVAVEVNAADVEPVVPGKFTAVTAGEHSATRERIGPSLLPVGQPGLGLANG
jgi:transcription antitermination factor NusG